MKSLKKYIEPEMKVKIIDWSDILTQSIDPENEPTSPQTPYTEPGIPDD